MKTSDRELLKGYYWNHDAIRKDMVRMQNIVSNSANYSSAEFSGLHTWFKFHEQCILSHHHGEDGFFFPIMREKQPAFKMQIDAMEHEHEELDKGLAALNKLFEKLSSGNKSILEEFNIAANEYIVLVTDHLNKEEKIVDSVINEIPKTDVLQSEEEYRKTMPRSEMSLLLPWLVDAMDEKDKKFFFTEVPFFVKGIYNLSAKPKYNKLLESI